MRPAAKKSFSYKLREHRFLGTDFPVSPEVDREKRVRRESESSGKGKYAVRGGNNGGEEFLSFELRCEGGKRGGGARRREREKVFRVVYERQAKWLIGERYRKIILATVKVFLSQ